MKAKTLAPAFAFALLAAFTFTAIASAQSAKYISLMVARFIPHKGYVFLFDVVGKYQKDEIVGKIEVAGKSIKLDCIYKEKEGLLSCTAPGLKKYMNAQAEIYLAGGHFYVVVPETVNCYGIFDWTRDLGGWEYIGEKCVPASIRVRPGDSITRYNPTWKGTYTYVYQNSVPCQDMGNGYYYGFTFETYYQIVCPPNG